MQHTHTYLINGDFNQAISPLDRGFAYGDGVFRTMVIRSGLPVNWPLHYQKLVAAIQAVLSEAIESGGTTLRDFLQFDGAPGYFKQFLNVYARKSEPCRACGTAIRHAVVGQRATYWCPQCQR